ncbi:pilus assembly FimT family protein [Vibrio sp. PNB22_3_1]
MKGSKGFTLIELSVVIATAALYLTLSVSFLLGVINDQRRENELDDFLDRVFLASKLQYQSYLQGVGNCYTADPPDYLFNNLSATYNVFSGTAQQWLNPALTFVRIDPNPISGRVSDFVVVMMLMGDQEGHGVMSSHPFLFNIQAIGPDTQYSYRIPFTPDTGWRATYSTNAASCVVVN